MEKQGNDSELNKQMPGIGVLQQNAQDTGFEVHQTRSTPANQPFLAVRFPSSLLKGSFLDGL